MKQVLSVILVIALFAVCFTACGEVPAETKTDAKPVDNAPSAVVSQVEQPAPDESQPQQNSAPAQQQEQTNETSLPAHQPVSTPNQPTTTVTPEEIHGDIAREYPTFVSEQALQTWLQKGSGAYETDRSNYLMQASKSNIVNYYHPSEDLIKLVSSNEIVLHTPSNTYIYQYIFDDGKELTLSLNTAKIPGFYESDESFLENKKQGYLMGEKGYQYYKDPKTGIEFYWNDADYDTTQIAWMQYGLVQFASFTGHKDILDELLPYLALEQVTVNLNSDHVTQ